VSRRALLFIRLCVFAAACAFLYVRILEPQRQLEWTPWGRVLAGIPWRTMAVVCALMLMNWGIEAGKWAWLVRSVERVGFLRAFTATIAGTSIALVTPNRTGEFAGRVLFLRPENRWRGGFATVLGSMAQFTVTIVVGLVMLAGSGYFPNTAVNAPPYAHRVIMTCTVALALGVGLVYFKPSLLRKVVLAFPFLQRFEASTRVLDGFSTAQLAGVLVLSLLRYTVFTLQFCLLLSAYAGIDPLVAVVEVPQVFLISTLVPTSMLSELAVRGTVATTFIHGPGMGVLIASSVLWLVNLVVPAIAGSFIVLFARIRTREGPA
jgi:hypothetical protein